MSKGTCLVWLRHDLRLADQPALTAALRRGGPVIPVFVWSPPDHGDWAPGGASRWWLHHSLAAFATELDRHGSRLIIRHGESLAELLTLARETGAEAVYWNRCYEPAITTRDTQIKAQLRAAGLAALSFNSALLHEPWTVANQSGKPFQVFTPFWRHCLTKPEPETPLPAPKHLPTPGHWPKSLALAALQLKPRPDWAGGLHTAWTPGETGAQAALRRFCADAFSGYTENRNRPDLTGTSRLSPHLHFGELSPRQVWQALKATGAVDARLASWRDSQFVAELGWREFAHHLLHHFPHTPTEPLRAEFKHFPWQDDAAALRAWQRGQTGYPLVDAGMRELWATGWMHNRVRMVVASFLVKDLRLPWQAGARWFWDTLVDADLASNTLGWQWTSGCGADAAPYFRVFNPVSQGEKFDPHGDYVRQWCPELARLPAAWIHQPAKAPANVLASAGVKLGINYPEPIVNHATAREVALEAYASIKGKRGP